MLCPSLLALCNMVESQTIDLSKTFQSFKLIAGARKLDIDAKYEIIKVFILQIMVTSSF